MKRTTRLKIVLLSLTCLGMILPAPALEMALGAESPNQKTTQKTTPAVTSRPHDATPHDATLHAGGVLVVQVVDSRGIPRPGSQVALSQADRKLATGVTDQSGSLSVKGLSGGIYEIAAGQTRAVYRLWAPRTAPPAARSKVVLVADSNPIRGQCDAGGPLSYWLSNPWVIAGLIGVAVAVPVAIHNQRQDRQPASP